MPDLVCTNCGISVERRLLQGKPSMPCACGAIILDPEHPANAHVPPGAILTPLPISAGALKRTHSMAITSLILSLGGLLLSLMCIGFPVSAVAVITGIVAITAINKEPDLFEGTGLAWIGILLGLLGAAIGLLVFISILISVGQSEGYYIF